MTLSVLHAIRFSTTARLRGTNFLKFFAAFAAEAAVTASDVAPGLRIVIKGRALKATKAIDKESAQKKEAKRFCEDREQLRKDFQVNYKRQHAICIYEGFEETSS